MTEFSTDGAGLHEAGALGMSRSGSATEGTDVFRALGVNMFSGLTLEALYHGGSGGVGVGDDNGIVAGSGPHNHLQSSRECNMSSAHSRSTLSVNPSPASLSWCRVAMILFPCGKGIGSGATREGVGLSGHLGRGIDGSTSGGQGLGGRGGLGREQRVWVDSAIGGWISILLSCLHCSLYWAIGPVICSPLFL